MDVYSAERIILLGPKEELLKQTRMDCFSVAGKLSRNVSVQTHPFSTTDQLSVALRTLDLSGLIGVVYFCPANGPSLRDRDVLALEEGEMEAALTVRPIFLYPSYEANWFIIQSSVLFLHALARQAMPLLQRQHDLSNAQANGTSHTTPTSPRNGNHAPPFFVVENPSREHNFGYFTSDTQHALLQAIARSPSVRGVEVGYAADMLTPPPPPPPKAAARPTTPQAHKPGQNGDVKRKAVGPIDIPQPTNGQAGQGAWSPNAEGESPTKLWSFWAAQNE